MEECISREEKAFIFFSAFQVFKKGLIQRGSGWDFCAFSLKSVHGSPLYKASQVDSSVEGFHSCSYIYTNVLQGSVDVNFL